MTPISFSFRSSWSSERTASTTTAEDQLGGKEAKREDTILFVKKSALRCISLLLIAVAASFLRVSLLFPSVVLTDISLTLFTAMAEALLRPLMIVCGLTPCSTCSFTSFSISPARTTTDVVPSPTSASCERAMSVNILAAGWTISSNYRSGQRSGRGKDHDALYLHNCCAVIGDRLLAI